jgi:ABC-type transport system involved in multi-copper enzyme maturation permease subunit
MFKEFFALEIRAAFKQPMIYIFFVLLAFMSCMAVVSDSVVIGGSIGNIYKNAPFVITQFVSIFSFLGILFAIAFFNNAALRDFNNQFNEILFSTPISKASYYFGRFTGALLLSTIPICGIFLGVLIGAWIGPLGGWIDADRVGPFYLETFTNNYLLFILPNMFFAGSIIFALASRFKNTVVSFVGALGLIIAYGVSGSLLSDIDNETLGGLLDSFGLRAYSVATRYFTPIEKNTLSPAFEGILLWNRLLWLSLGAAILFLSYLSFSFKEKNSRKKAQKEEKAAVKKAIMSAPKVQARFTNALQWKQFKSLFSIGLLNIVKSTVFKVLFLFSLILMVVEMAGGYEYYGLQSYPLTYIVVDTVTDSTSLFVFIILIFFSGELVWYDRNNHIHEVINATPHASIASLVAKCATLLGVVSLLYAFSALVGIIYQLLLGFTDIDLSLYFSTFLYDELPNYFLYSILFIFIQVLSNHRYQGYFISLLVVFVWDILLLVLDVRSNLLDLSGGPSLSYSDMNGFGPGLTGAIWFALYWGLFAMVLLFLAGLFWVRSSGGGIKSRLLKVKTNLTKPYAVRLSIVTILWLTTASFIYYNTKVLNSYHSSDELENAVVKYEKKYKKYENITLPKVKEISYYIDIYPHSRDVKAKAEILIKNEAEQAIDSIHYNLDEDWETSITIPGGERVYNDDTLGYCIYQLKKPLLPGDSLRISIETNYITKGFENDRGNTSIIKNGTFINNGIIPSMGYNSNIELSDKNDRKKHGLPPKDRMPELVEADSCGTPCMFNYLSEGRSDWVKIETYISTSADQVAIAPGSLLKEWEEDGRKHYHYKVDVPSQEFCSFVSADYQVAKRKWNDISLEVYYDEKHDFNIEMMLDALEKSLKYYTQHFGPYYHQQARIIEFPRYATFAQAFPGTMPYSEAFGFIIDLEDSTKNNVIDAVIAHEMAHQWWAHQEVGASMQGGTMLTESFAEYSSLMVMKQEKNELEMKEFLKYDFDRYLRGRSFEDQKELPLYKVENQSYIHYGKGSVILYALQSYIGEEKVNKALRNFLNEFKYKTPPYPRSVDFLRHLEKEVPDSLNYLITDWFKEITLYDFRLEEATYRPTSDNRYEVSFSILANKIKADTLGKESIFAPKDWVDIGLFKDDDEKELLAVKRVFFDQDTLHLSMLVDTIPARAGIDPRRLLIERIYSDNSKKVEKAE